MGTNRQRAMIDSHPAWIDELNQRDEANRLREEQRRAKQEKCAQKKAEQEAIEASNMLVGNITIEKLTKCSNLGCTNKTSAKGKKPEGWGKCPGKGCGVWTCGLEQCKAAKELHSDHCKCLP